MSVRLDHLIVYATDQQTSAEFWGRILGVEVSPRWGPFLPVKLANGVTLDFDEVETVDPTHYAFLVTEAEFDAIFDRIRSEGVRFYADPGRRHPGTINHHWGGRGVYFDDPDEHLLEVITQPYGDL
jgi:catechol 2,3-dioxygenase-like lactoylglutathione lyase family enzyme